MTLPDSPAAMSKPTDMPAPQLPPQPRDWFVAAIECEGSVGACLASVLAELGRRADFVAALKRNLELTGARGIDAISDVGQRLKGLENTLRFRLGILRPERQAAWFRAPATTSGGPFSSAVLEEPVFAPYDAAAWSQVKGALEAAWQARSAGNLPFQDASACLWRTLLGYAETLESIAVMPAPFAHLRLDTLPDGMPQDLESRALRAFLINVRGELIATRERLSACYLQLWEASEKLWSAQALAELRKASEQPPRARAASAADDVREEFKRRRAHTDARRMLTPADIDALRFMGFETIPTSNDLRQRYLAMAKRLHPDLQGGSDMQFKNLTRAYERLTTRVSSP